MTCSAEELESLLIGKIVGTSNNTKVEQESESNMIGNELLLEILRELERIKASRGIGSQGHKDS